MIDPKAISNDEWKEIMNLPEVIDAWELGETDTVKSFSAHVYGAKFYHRTFFPRTAWTLYLLTDGTSDGISMMITRTSNGFFVEK
jgi:hypothetical protein